MQLQVPVKHTYAVAPASTQIAICLADSISRRLIEGISKQLDLNPLVLTEAELREPNRLDSVELLLADEPVAQRIDHRGIPSHHRQESMPALVAVVSAQTSDSPLLPQHNGISPFDGILALPQPPAQVLAQLSVILYAHRAYRRRYESAMEELSLNRRIFSSVTSGISVADATRPDFPLVYVNPAFEVMTGYCLEEVQGRNCRFLQRDESDQPGLTLVREALRDRRETVALLRNFRKDGTPFWNELSLSPIRDRSGAVTHFVGIQNDVTARIAFEDALRQSEKLAAVGRLAASIAHEINNPLESVTNLLYLARHDTSGVKQDMYLELAEQELQRVSQLTAQSLRFYKQSSRPQAVRPVEILNAVLDVYLPKLANYGIGLERRDRMAGSIVCLESEIRQVLSNLIRNAMDAMLERVGTPRRARLLIRTRDSTQWATDVRGVTITIADTGSGMAPETVQKLYTAFYTTKGISGTGLGLWVSSEIVARHQGTLSVRSRQAEPSGTVFTLFLPYQAITT